MGVKKKLKLTSLLGLSLLIMTACATNGVTSDITAESADFWSKLVYFFAKIIRFLSFDISIGVGIILFTVLIRTVLLPVFQVQMVASRKMQEAQPRIKALREQYPGRDMESRTKLEQEMRKVFKEIGQDLAQTLKNGREFSQTIGTYPFFRKELSLIIEYGEVKSKLGSELEIYAEKTWEAFFTRVNRTMNLVQPLVFIFVALIIVLLYAAMLMPMYQNMEVNF
ncbi:preprotein translocase subunit YidC1 [Streptococcus pneumoniae]|nr:preprotein translocase subunit YidC1 [Streptococcus pneumoniae]